MTGGPGAKPHPERGPQSSQSVHAVHVLNSEPSPPSSQSPSDANAHVFTHVPEPGGPGGGGGGGTLCPSQLPASRGPQSSQSWHGLHVWNSEPSPPSSQSPSEA